MERIFKEFVCTTKVGETETHHIFRAVVKPSYDLPYRIKTITRRYENGFKTIYSESEQYFQDKLTMVETFKYHFELCKNNLFTEFIKVTK